uniref:Uncharacterized protein n=1 Tax=Tetranychus urticae TaxID=32264 RepID=T1KLH8_TETUR
MKGEVILLRKLKFIKFMMYFVKFSHFESLLCFEQMLYLRSLGLAWSRSCFQGI